MKTRKEIESRIELFMSNIRKGLSYDANVVLLTNDIEDALEQVKNHVDLANVRQQSELLKCDKHHWMYRGERIDGRFVCERCGEIE